MMSGKTLRVVFRCGILLSFCAGFFVFLSGSPHISLAAQAVKRAASRPMFSSTSPYGSPSGTSIAGGVGDVLNFAVTNGTNSGITNKYIYTQFSTTGYTFHAGDYIEYDVRLLNNVAEAGGIEIYLSDGSSFRDNTSWVDQNGVRGHPAADISPYAYNQWYHRKLTIPSSAVGKTAVRWLVAGENDTSGLSYTAQYDNILVTDGTNYPRSGGTIFRDSSEINNVGDYLQSDASETLSVTNIGGGSSDILAFYVENVGGGGNKYIYKQFSTQSYQFQTGDYIEYDVKLLDDVPGAGGIEINAANNTDFRDASGWVDQNGISGRPDADLTSRAYGQWYHRILAVPSSMINQTAVSWQVAGENDGDFVNYRAQYDNIVVTDGHGNVRSGGSIFQNASQFNWNTLKDYTGSQANGSLTTLNLNGVPPGNPQVISTTYPTSDVVVASFVATNAPYNADNTGATDATAAIQHALTDCYNAGGGVVWLPAGKYLVSSSIAIPNHVTLRGDRRDPDSGSGSYGTVILANVASGSSSDPGLFRIWGSAGVNGLTVYYPNQSATSPTAYPYTFEILGATSNNDAYMSSTVQNVTLLDSYLGITTSTTVPHEMHEIRNVKGTALYEGLHLDNSADTSKTENCTFNGSYWANLDSSVSGTKPTLAQINAWTQANGTGARFGGLDWDEMENLSFSNYLVGIDVFVGHRSEPALLLSNLDVESSNIALKIDDLDGHVGLSIANSTFKANVGSNPVAVQINISNGGSIFFDNSTIGGGATNAVQLLGNVMASFHNCTFDNWTGMYALTANSGTLLVEGSTFTPTLSASKKGIGLQAGLDSAALLGNTYSPSGASYLYDNSSSGVVTWQDTGYNFASSGVSSYTPIPSLPKPATTNFYNVKASPYNAAADGVTDDTAAIQSALNAAGTAGGGTVYLPAGIYTIATHLSVPAGVELRGSEDLPHRAMLNGPATGTILYANEGHGTSTPNTDTAFITLNGTGAGVRGLSVDYPGQATDSASNIVAYPWTIRGNGSSVYAFDLAFVNTYNGVDFATNECDNHYLNQVNGTALHQAISIGNSTQGWVEDNLFNITYWARAYGLPNILDEGSTMFLVAGNYTHANLNAYTVGNGAQNEHMLNDFVYSSLAGFSFSGNANAVLLNAGADGGGNPITVSGTGSNGVTIIGLGGCGCQQGGGTVLTVSGGTAKVYGLMTLASFNSDVNVTGGNVYLIGASFENSTASITGGSMIMAATLFKQSSSAQVTVGSGATGNLWGNAGQGGFTYSFAAGSSGGYSGNVSR